MRPYILAETNWKHIHDQPIDLVILPWGATEAHNYHMPYATDVIEADTIAAESARLAWEQGAKVMVLPTIPVRGQYRTDRYFAGYQPVSEHPESHSERHH
jgi:creatinine amidohydrolase